MFATRIEDGSTRRIIIRPNRSLTWEQTKIVYFCIASYSLAIAGVFAVMGFWPVLPFAGGEIAMLGIAFYVNAVAGTSVQVVTVGGDVVKVEKERPGPRCEWLFQRAWARVDIDWSAGDRSSRLVVRSHGNEVALGEFLTETERKRLAATLVDVIGSRGPTGVRRIREAERLEDA
jgi:uncharacterized membrane protein